MGSARDKVRAYYDAFGTREWDRLSNPNDGAVEWVLNTHTISRYLPNRPCRILDIGGGPGRYAIWLAKQGHHVLLGDLSPKLIEIARARAIAEGVEKQIEMEVCDATDLSHLIEGSFDAVLCLGPFYHLPNLDDRIKATKGICKVLKPEGVAYIALMPYYTLIRRTLALQDENSHFASPGWIEELREHGKFTNDTPGRFNEGYGARPDEIKPFFEANKLSSLDLLSSESILVGMQHTLERAKESGEEVYEAALKVVLDGASDPSILGLAGHLLYVGRKASTL